MKSRASRAVPLTLLRDTRGMTATELVLLLCLIAVVCFAAVAGLGQTLRGAVAGAERVLADESMAAPIAAASSSAIAPSSGHGTDARGTDARGTDARGTSSRGVGDAAGGGIARGIGDGLVDVASGAIDGAVAIGGAVASVVRNPDRTRAWVADAIANPGATAVAAASGAAHAVGSVASGLADWGSQLAEGDGYTRARMLTGAGATFVPLGAVANVARGAGAVSKATRATRAVARGPSGEALDAPPISWGGRVFGDDDREMAPGGIYMRGRRGYDTIGVNMTEDIHDALGRRGVYTVVAHGRPGASAFARTSEGGTITPREMAATMIEGGYRGGDVALVSCSAACSRLPLTLRRELDDQLARRGEPGRVGTIAAPTDSVYGDGVVLGDGHWRLFEHDTAPLLPPVSRDSWAGVLVVGGAVGGSAAVSDGTPSAAERERQRRRSDETEWVRTGPEG
jgi:Flp pilus assembly pilin Flp